MEQIELIVNKDSKKDQPIALSQYVSVRYRGSDKKSITLYHHNIPLKTIDLTDRVAKKLFVVELVEMGAKPGLVAKVLGMSRQTIHNYLQIKKHFGQEGLIISFSPGRSKNMRTLRESNREHIPLGNKARQLETMRKIEKEQQQKEEQQLSLPFGDQSGGIDADHQPFSEIHDWKLTRYAGVFTYLITLIHLNDWLRLIMAYFGTSYQVFMAFLLMVAKRIRSIEQVKNLRKHEAGLILGIGHLPTRQHIRIWLHEASRKEISKYVLKDFFGNQMKRGLVGLWLWFSDGHLLPYTGKKKVHLSYNTQRQMMVPGRTNMVTCDSSGRVVDFEIQEGKGDLRGYLLELGGKWKNETGECPVMVFDREGTGSEFFYKMNQKHIPFVTWEKNVDAMKLDAIEAGRFGEEFEMNERKYRVFEDEKEFRVEIGDGSEKFTLRRISVWNVTSNRRTRVLSNASIEKMDAKECAKAILSRWGSSENTFKHLGEKHPLNYQPGYELSESENQEIANPAIKKIKVLLKNKKKELDKLYRKQSKSDIQYNKDGSIRKNSVHERTSIQIEKLKVEQEKLKKQASELPERIDISKLEDYTCFEKISNESKNLFDFVTSSVWNARKQMTEWLNPFFNNTNEVVDLFYAITDCHGWVKSSPDQVIVRLEELEQPARRAAQIQLCRKLTDLSVQIPTGKRFVIEVGHAPKKMAHVQKNGIF
jgi:hypothetical protein